MKSTKTTLLALTLALGTLTLLSGCDSGPADLNDAQKLTDALGVPVFLWAGKEDVCAQKQFHQLIDEFNSASENERSIFLGEVKKYDAVIFNASQIVAPVTGKFRSLALVDANGAVLDHHDFIDTRVFKELKGTTVSKTEHLVINPESAPDRADNGYYQTQDQDLYTLIVNGGENYLEDAVAAGKLQDVTQRDANLVNCGKLVDLKDLL